MDVYTKGRLEDRVWSMARGDKRIELLVQQIVQAMQCCMLYMDSL